MFKYFLSREIKENYIGNLTGFSWVLIQPVITLIIYTVVFEKIFKTPAPEEAKEVGFIVYLAVAFWPWNAFAESLIKAITAVTNKKDLIGKVKINLKTAVIATVTASFLISIAGFLLIMIILIVIGKNINYGALPLLLFPLLQIYLFTIALGLILSSLQVFVRDTIHLMTTLITLWFFSTPIIYSVSIIPESIRNIMKFNPLYTPITFIREALLTDRILNWNSMLILSLFIIVLLYLANRMFDKLEPYFEDFI